MGGHANSSDYERRYGRNWSETDAGGTSGMGASRTNGDRGPIGATEHAGRTGGTRGPSDTDGDDRQRLPKGVHKGREQARGA